MKPGWGRWISPVPGTVDLHHFYTRINETMDYSNLVQTIRLAAQEKKTELVLSHQGLTLIPPEIGQLTALRALDLSDNQPRP